ncbi:MAG: PEP-CTERM sorting domain-containing protein, partial [Myxococcota bacterium]
RRGKSWDATCSISKPLMQYVDDWARSHPEVVIMKVHALLACVAFLSQVAAPVAANAASIPFVINVEVDRGSGFEASVHQAIAGQGALIVKVSVGDTVRFTVGLQSTASSNITTFTTTLTVDDPNDIDYVPGSGVALDSVNFAPGADPDSQLTDATPGAGTISRPSSQIPIASIDLYRVDYIVQATNLLEVDTDFAVEGVFSTIWNTDSSAGGVAAVNLIDVGWLFPEPSSILLLGSGLAALAGLTRRKNRRP